MFVAVGCGSAGDRCAWVNAQGGTLVDARQQRAEAACALFSGDLGGRAPQIHVLNSDVVGAYGWPDAQIFVSRGLVDLLTDQQLAAAVAHEMGHLLADGHLHTIVSLRGCCQTPDAEVRADAVAVELLQSRGIAPIVMIEMLRRVESAPSVSPSCRAGIGHRIELIAQRVAVAPAIAQN
jgi:Zn-dependent protease with chaperone function